MTHSLDKFVQFLKLKKHQKNINTKTVASLAEVSLATVYYIESEKKNPSIETAGRILEAIGETWESFGKYVREENESTEV